MGRPKVIAIEEADLQEAIPGCKAYWNANGIPVPGSGCCGTEFLDKDGRRYMCEAYWGHDSEHAATKWTYGADGTRLRVWTYGRAVPEGGEDRG